VRRYGRCSNGAARGFRRRGSRNRNVHIERVCAVVNVEVQDHYAVLGVGRDASLRDIHRAYRSLARRYHPDVYAGHDAAPRFREISDAYEVLHDTAKRALYDAAPAGAASAKPVGRRTSPEWVFERGLRDVPRFIDAEPGRSVVSAPSTRAAIRVSRAAPEGLLFRCFIHISDWRW
jgi:DnaJ-domain-containing protein 1